MSPDKRKAPEGTGADAKAAEQAPTRISRPATRCESSCWCLAWPIGRIRTVATDLSEPDHYRYLGELQGAIKALGRGVA
jgi:hypothetical protein